MVTWTFNLLALFVGFAVGLLLGGLLFAFMETKDGGPKVSLRDAKREL